MSEKRTKLFDEWAETYDDSVTKVSGFPFEGYDQVLETIVRLTEPSAGMTVLDVGIGTGNLAGRLTAAGCRVWGMDFSTRMLAKAREKLPGVELIKADLAGDWPIDVDLTFDRVVSAYVFHEFDCETKVGYLRRFADQHLAEHGRLVIGDVSFRSVKARREAHRQWEGAWDEDEHYWAADRAIEALGRSGLAVGYTQVSFCGGVYVIEPAPVDRG